MTEHGFYRAFEERYRGSRELITSRLSIYLPFVKPLSELYTPATAIDLGCGRGEWLELLQDSGFAAEGIDLDHGMLSACHERGLKVKACDAIEFLKSLPDASQLVVSGFHLAEHIEFGNLQILVQEALRILKPGGLLILETPNPENLIVGTANFYLDPTHQRPIPPGLLSFLIEYTGFETVKILRLQESEELFTNSSVSLLEVLQGVSPDYSIVAQKSGPAEIISAIKPAFDKEYGITLGSLAYTYNWQISDRIRQADDKAQKAYNVAQNAYNNTQEANKKIQEVNDKTEQVIRWANALLSRRLIRILYKITKWPELQSIQKFRSEISKK